MNSTTRIYWIHALSPLRIGVEEGLDAVNLPTMREAHTGHPLVPGSSLRGVLRSEVMATNPDLSRQLFGPERDNAGDHRGALAITDANLVALPVRSLRGTWAWVTSPLVLRRLARNRSQKLTGTNDIPEVTEAPYCVCTGSVLVPPAKAQPSGADVPPAKVFLEEYEVSVEQSATLDRVAATLATEIWPGADMEPARAFFAQRLLLVPDNTFGVLCQTAMELRTRVCISRETGTADTSGPWTEEAMPAESLLSGLIVGRETLKADSVGAERKRLGEAEALRLLPDRLTTCNLRLGGHTGVGYGQVLFRIVEG